MNINTVEVIGYLGSILVAISLMMKSLLRLRLINLFGAPAPYERTLYRPKSQ